ncbi:unnamed protein product, partial [Mesorhabditis spiculigera]
MTGPPTLVTLPVEPSCEMHNQVRWKAARVYERKEAIQKTQAINCVEERVEKCVENWLGLMGSSTVLPIEPLGISPEQCKRALEQGRVGELLLEIKGNGLWQTVEAPPVKKPWFGTNCENTSRFTVREGEAHRFADQVIMTVPPGIALDESNYIRTGGGITIWQELAENACNWEFIGLSEILTDFDTVYIQQLDWIDTLLSSEPVEECGKVGFLTAAGMLIVREEDKRAKRSPDPDPDPADNGDRKWIPKAELIGEKPENQTEITAKWIPSFSGQIEQIRKDISAVKRDLNVTMHIFNVKIEKLERLDVTQERAVGQLIAERSHLFDLQKKFTMLEQTIEKQNLEDAKEVKTHNEKVDTIIADNGKRDKQLETMREKIEKATEEKLQEMGVETRKLDKLIGTIREQVAEIQKPIARMEPVHIRMQQEIKELKEKLEAIKTAEARPKVNESGFQQELEKLRQRVEQLGYANQEESEFTSVCLAHRQEFRHWNTRILINPTTAIREILERPNLLVHQVDARRYLVHECKDLEIQESQLIKNHRIGERCFLQLPFKTENGEFQFIQISTKDIVPQGDEISCLGERLIPQALFLENQAPELDHKHPPAHTAMRTRLARQTTTDKVTNWLETPSRWLKNLSGDILQSMGNLDFDKLTNGNREGCTSKGEFANG